MIQRFLPITKEKDLILVIKLLKYFREKILVVCIIFDYDDWAIFIYDE